MKKKVPYEGFTRRSDEAGKTRTALLEMCAAPQGTRTAKSMQIDDIIQNFVFFKMSDESEHSESKFYYSDQLTDAEMLKLPTHSESTERKSTLLTNEEVKQAVKKTTFPDELSDN